MTLVTRAALETFTSLDVADAILHTYHTSHVEHPMEDFLLRRGINKTLEEEFYPLVTLAHFLPNATSVRLILASSQGHDAEIHLASKQILTIQITCAHEGYERALFRKELMQRGSASPQSNRHRDPDTGDIVSSFQPAINVGAVVSSRLDRVVAAVRAKEVKFYPGTEVLLVYDEGFHWDTVREELPNAVATKLASEPPSSYSSIYVCFGDTVVKVA